ncbi:MAG: hypothetical protein ACQ5SW_00775 [Sphaerochaetaceae bacterium]
MEDDAQAFIENLEKRHEAPITWRTYATWYGNNKETLREFGVFLYRVRNTLFFEDFERNPSLFGISLKPRKKKEPFIKYEGSFNVDEVASTRSIPKSVATKAAQGMLSIDQIRQATTLDKIFRQMVEMVLLKNGTVHFFELMDRKQFVSELGKISKED